MFGYNWIPYVYAIGSLILMNAVSSEGSLVISPMNTAIVAGNRTTLYCSTNKSSNSIAWAWSSPNGDLVAYSTPGSPCAISSTASFASSYAVGVPSTGSSYCNLIILNATSVIAGSYSCSDGSLGGSAVLLVLDSDPQCPPYAVNNTVVYPGKVTMNCSAVYPSSSGFELHRFDWSTTNCSESFHPNNNAPYSTLSCNTSSSTPIPSYSCAVVYGSDPANSDTPSCSTNPVTVFWCPIAVTISGAPDGYIAPGSNLTCSASGNPSPTYQWFNSKNSLLANGPLLTVWNQDNYTCTASNIANGSLCSTSVSHFVDVTINPGPDPSPTSTQSNVTAIVLGVLLGGGVPVIILIIIIIVLLKKRKANTTAGDQSIYEAPQQRIIEQETPYASLDLTGKDGESNNDAIYQNSPIT